MGFWFNWKDVYYSHRDALSYRDIEEIMIDRGINVDHSTVQEWVVKYTKLFEKNIHKKKRNTDKSWRMDETYIKVKGKWKYLYRAVDKYGNTIDFLLTAKRNTKAALRFLNRAIKNNGMPEKITIDGSDANNAAIESINKGLKKEDQITCIFQRTSITHSTHLRSLIPLIFDHDYNQLRSTFLR